MKKKDLGYFLVFVVSYVAINFCIARLFGLSFNHYNNGNMWVGAYHFLRLAELIIITALCFVRGLRCFLRPLIWFDICLVVSWIFDTFFHWVLFEESISLVFIALAVVITLVVMLGFAAKIISRILNKIDFYKKYKPYIFMAIFILVYLSIFTINLFISPEYAVLNRNQSYTGRMWMVGNILLIMVAIYYLFKIKHFNWADLVVAVLLGAAPFVFEHNPITALETGLCYYAACGIFRKCSYDKKVFNFDFVNSLKSFGIGMLCGIPLSIINVLIDGEHGFLDPQVWDLSNIWNSLLNSSGAMSEEITYHFLPFAMVVYWFGSKMPKNYKAQMPIYVFLILPHAMQHIATGFALNPVLAILDCIKESIIFGIPFIWLMKNKGIQSNSMAHTIVVLLYRMCGNKYVS